MNDPGHYDPPPPADPPPPSAPPPIYGGPPPAGPTPPPPGGGVAVAGFPWEERQTRGFFPALIDSIKLLITAPGDAYDRMRERGDFLSPLLFAILVGWVMAIIGQIWSSMFQGVWMSMMPGEMQDQFAAAATSGAMGLVITLFAAPIAILIGLFLWGGIVHLFLMMFGALKDSTAGFEGTVRAIAYAQVSSLAQIIPLAGGPIAAVWGIVLYIIGLSRLHRTTPGKAAAAVLVPIALCCICAIAVVVAVIGSIGAALSGME